MGRVALHNKRRCALPRIIGAQHLDPIRRRPDHSMTPTLEHLVDAERIELRRAKSPKAVMPMVTPIGRKALDEHKAERG